MKYWNIKNIYILKLLKALKYWSWVKCWKLNLMNILKLLKEFKCWNAFNPWNIQINESIENISSTNKKLLKLLKELGNQVLFEPCWRKFSISAGNTKKVASDAEFGWNLSWLYKSQIYTSWIKEHPHLLITSFWFTSQ